MPEFAWVELERDLGRELWSDFRTEFGFRRGVRPSDWPAIQEPVPSATWDIESVARGLVAQLVCDVIREATEYWDSVFWHDSVHPSAQYRPHRVTDVRDLEGWEYTHFPNGDYSIFVARDHSFGIVGNHHENSLCFFGAPAVEASERLNTGLLSRMLRRDGHPVA